jgi:hypothetical protein
MPVQAKNKVKKQNTTQQAKNKQAKAKTAKSKKGNKKLSKNNKRTPIASFNEEAHQNTILKNSTTNFQTKLADSIPEKVVTILSAFKPQLKNLSKVNFTNASAQSDTNSVFLSYQVPSQNLSFRYKPIKLIPRAYRLDTVQNLLHATNVKMGLGNYSHFYIGVNTSFQDSYRNFHSFEIFNEYSEGSHHLQSLKDIVFNYIGDWNLNTENKLNTQFYFKQSKRNRYGLVPDSSTFPIENYAQNYYLTGLNISWQNLKKENSSFQYDPSLQIEHFEGMLGTTNNTMVFKDPMYLKLKNGMQFNFDMDYSFNQYQHKNIASHTLHLFTFQPSLDFNKFKSQFKIGIQPAITQDGFNMYPIIEFSRKLNDTNTVLNIGWQTQLTNNQYSKLVQINPWLNTPTSLSITTKESKFVKVQFNASKFMNYGFVISSNDYENLALFNRVPNQDNVKYGVLYESIFEKKASTIELDAFLNYQFSERIHIHNNLKYIQFNHLEENAKPWGILPLDIHSKMSWLPNKKWIVEGDLQYFTGSTQSNLANMPYATKSGLLLNASFTYQLSKKWSAWAKGENLLDKPVERWGDYPSLGVQLIAGVVYSFRK